MGESPALEATSLPERCVLLALAELERRDRTPANAIDLLERCRDRETYGEEVVPGRFSEGDVVSSCRGLVDADLVAERSPDATSPAGKGRPSYELAVDVAAVAALAERDDRLAWDEDAVDAR